MVEPFVFLALCSWLLLLGDEEKAVSETVLTKVPVFSATANLGALMRNKQPMSELQQNGAYEVCSTLSKNIKDERYTSCADEYVKMDPVYEKI